LVVDEAVYDDGVIVVPVTLINAQPLVGFSHTIEYDSKLLTAKLVDNTGLITEGFSFFVGGVKEPGVVRIVAVSDMDIGDGVERLPAGEHEVARIRFERNEGVLNRDVPLTVSNSVMAISHDRALSHRTVDGLVKAAVALPAEFSLAQNYPNPFNSTTEIRYTLPVDCRVSLEIYNLLGQRVCILVDEDQPAGYKSVRWDGRDDHGQQIASGVYFYRISTGKFAEIKKMVLLL